MQRFREGIHIRTMKAKRKVEEISKEDIQTFLKKNAFVLFTVGAVIAGGYASSNSTEGGGIKKKHSPDKEAPSPPLPFSRDHFGLCVASLQDVLSRGEVLFFPWRATDENAADACSTLTGLQSNNRWKKKNEKKNRRLSHKSVSGS